MKLTSKIVTVVAVSMMIAQVVHPELRKIVAEKSSDTSGWSAIQIWQGNTKISSANFKKTTATGAKFNNPANSELKYLFFDTASKEPVEVKFYWTASASPPIGDGPGDVPVFNSPKKYTQYDLPFGAIIKINCPPEYRGVGNCTMTIQAPAIKFNKVKVVKNAQGTHAIEWIVKSSSVKREPRKNETYGTVTIKAATGVTNKLKVPNNKPFWIVVSSNDKKDKVLLNEVISDQINAGLIKSNSIIDIDGQGKATIRASSTR